MKNLSWKKTGDSYYLASHSEELVKLQYEPDNKIIFWMNNEVYEVKRSGSGINVTRFIGITGK